MTTRWGDTFTMKTISVNRGWSLNFSLNQVFSRQVRARVRSSPPRSARINRKFLSVSSRGSQHHQNSLQFKKYTLPQKPNNAEKSPISRMKRTAYIALGSNLGDRIGWIEKACNEMDARGIRIKRTSSLWETEPMYVLDQDRFVNAACEVRSPYHSDRTCSS
jgi:hypothetical protein